ncbi:hypothetical protein ANN_03474 [Periplaneta americana]|uniref:Uncharacterized protein n=1 Tax=Periplaneta americana TaxID=6978 RepID=A0ABQ8TZ81_PERAM|nr:hypothetical protein ANN_03474 [Periplaneta americana]
MSTPVLICVTETKAVLLLQIHVYGKDLTSFYDQIPRKVIPLELGGEAGTIAENMATYGLKIIWEKLSLRNLEKLENVKSRFLKCALSFEKTAPTRMVYELAKETFHIEDLRTRMLLPSTEPYF